MTLQLLVRQLHRRVPPIYKSLHNAFSETNAGISRFMQVLKTQDDAYKGVRCDTRDVYNYERDMKEENRAHDESSS